MVVPLGSAAGLTGGSSASSGGGLRAPTRGGGRSGRSRAAVPGVARLHSAGLLQHPPQGLHTSACHATAWQQHQQLGVQQLAGSSLLPRPAHCPQQQRQQQQQEQYSWLAPQQPQELKHVQQSRCRCSVVAAAGRRRRAETGAPSGDDEPELSMDDVMYAGGGDDAEDALLLEEEDEEEFEEFEDDEEEDADEEDLGEEEGEELAAGEGEELEGWDAALLNFDAAQDAAPPPRAPTKEELEHQAALDMVRFDPETAEEEGISLVVTDVPATEAPRDKTFDEKTEGLSLADKQELEQNMASYTVFPMFYLDLMVASTPDGALNLAECFCLDTLEDTFLRPTIAPDMPAGPALYQVIPWEHIELGDMLKNIDTEHLLMKMYFVGLNSTSPHEVDMSRLYCFDVFDRTMSVHTPTVLGGGTLEDMVEPVLRIREDGIFIEEAELLPGTYFIAEGFAGHPTEPYTQPDKAFDPYDYVRMGMWDRPRPQEELLAAAGVGAAGAAAAVAARGGAAGGGVRGQAGSAGGGVQQQQQQAAEEEVDSSGLEERLEDLELMEELDDMPDVPAVDMM